jgi:16S rRNA (uracil1498-N3)-methyltransferase
MEAAKIRLYVDHPLGQGQTVPLDRDQAHYLFGVMRQKAGGDVALFNGRDGEWTASITQVGKRAGVLTCLVQTKPLRMPPDLWLIFAPIKKARTDFIVEKAAEMGAARIIPVGTDFTNSERVRQDRLQAHAVEAAEQCGGTYVPEVTDLQKLSKLLEAWPADRKLMFCDEAEAGARLALPVPGLTRDPDGQRKNPQPEVPDHIRGGEIVHFDRCPTYRRGEDSPKGSWAILIGPEGGFSEAERTRLGSLPFTHAVSLGPRILRADTAAVAAMTLWQQAFGDW